VQDEIAERVIDAVAPELHDAELRRSAAKGTRDLNAWDYYIRGMGFLNREEREANARARELFGQATDLDPAYAEAWARRAWTHIRDIDMRSTDDRDESVRLAFELSRHAIELDDGSAVAHLCLGSAHVWRGEIEQRTQRDPARRRATSRPATSPVRTIR